MWARSPGLCHNTEPSNGQQQNCTPTSSLTVPNSGSRALKWYRWVPSRSIATLKSFRVTSPNLQKESNTTLSTLDRLYLKCYCMVCRVTSTSQARLSEHKPQGCEERAPPGTLLSTPRSSSEEEFPPNFLGTTSKLPFSLSHSHWLMCFSAQESCAICQNRTVWMPSLWS